MGVTAAGISLEGAKVCKLIDDPVESSDVSVNKKAEVKVSYFRK